MRPPSGGALHRWTHDASRVQIDLTRRRGGKSAFSVGGWGPWGAGGMRRMTGDGPTFDCTLRRLIVVRLAAFQVQA